MEPGQHRLMLLQIRHRPSWRGGFASDPVLLHKKSKSGWADGQRAVKNKAVCGS